MKFWINVAVLMATLVSALTMYMLGVVMAVKGAFIAVETCSHAGGGYMIASVVFLAIGASLNAALYVLADRIDEKLSSE